MHIFDVGESLPQWEQGQEREFKNNRPNEGVFWKKSGVSILYLKLIRISNS